MNSFLPAMSALNIHGYQLLAQSHVKITFVHFFLSVNRVYQCLLQNLPHNSCQKMVLSSFVLEITRRVQSEKTRSRAHARHPINLTCHLNGKQRACVGSLIGMSPYQYHPRARAPMIIGHREMQDSCIASSKLARMLLVLKLINCRRVCLSASLPLSLTLFGKRVDRKKRAVVEARLASSSSPAAASVEKPFHRAMHVMCWRCAPPSPPLGSNGYVNFSR